MSFLHCHTKGCDFSQDDFYSVNGYNPANYLQTWMKDLCSDDVNEQFSTDSNYVKENGPLSRKEVIAREFEKFANNIREMKWITYEQWAKDRATAVCPKCGKRNWDID